MDTKSKTHEANPQKGFVVQINASENFGLTVHRSCDSAELAWNSDGAGQGGPAPLTLLALTLRRNRRRDGNPAILCETAEAE